MRHPKIIIAGIGLAVVAAGGGIAAAATTSSPAASATAAPATVRTTSANVAGRTETVLVNGHGLPLYYYRPDTATRSLVTGGLAQLWPPLTSPAPAAAGLSGKLAVLSDINGRQVTYNGHPLYLYVADKKPGDVTGQGVTAFGAAWFALTPSGGQASTPVPSSGGGAASGGGGY
jgi:predicted lipoprotein with Yx(FWY)xxD motif